MELYQQRQAVMGTEALLTISSAIPKTAVDGIFKKLWLEIHEFDQRFSRFRNDSELTELNENNGKWTPISTEFQRLLMTTKNMAKDTGGMFNPFILPALAKAGYRSSWIPTDATAQPPDYSDRQVVDANALEVKKAKARIPANSAIDLGGIGKGYLLDKLSRMVEQVDVRDYWFSLGGDIIARGKDDKSRPWQISIANATEPQKTIASVLIPDDHSLAITTSGTTKRSGTHAGKAWHHIIDPASGQSAQTDVLTASLVMPDAVQADVYASCLVALGSAKSASFIKSHKIKNSLVQIKNKSGLAIKTTGTEFIQ